MIGLGNSLQAASTPSSGGLTTVMSYTSDFTSDADGWDMEAVAFATAPEVEFNVDNVSGEDDTLKITLAGEPDGTFKLRRQSTADSQGWLVGDEVTFSFDIKIDDNIPLNGQNASFQVRLGQFNSSRSASFGVSDNQWTTISGTFDSISSNSGTSETGRAFNIAFNSSNTRPSVNDIIYIKNVSITQKR